MLESLTAHLTRGSELSEAQVGEAVEALIQEAIPPAEKAEFLVALAHKGETPSEVAAFVRALRDRATAPPVSDRLRARHILDVVGTGGDRLNTFNISTATALVCAAAGVSVAKHGNRAVTSACGSADVLETLGIPVDSTPETAGRLLEETGFVFLFAPRFHPAFRHVAAARKLCAERGVRTIFNYLGPLLNPVRPSAMLVGVAQPELCKPTGQALQALGVSRAMVVCGSAPTPTGTAWFDELSILGPTRIAEFYQSHCFNECETRPDDLPVPPATLPDLLGGDKIANAAIVRRVLTGEERAAKRDAVLLNAAAALFVADAAPSLAAGWELARDVITSGRAAAKLAQLASATT